MRGIHGFEHVDERPKGPGLRNSLRQFVHPRTTLMIITLKAFMRTCPL